MRRLLSSSTVSSAGMISDDCSADGGRRLDGWLKNAPVGKYITSVFDFFLFVPTCISNPSCLNVLLMMFSPMVKSSLETKMKEPSSRYSMLKILKVALWAEFLMEWHVSLASGNVVLVWSARWNRL